ncbi:MAG: hypothetical protein OHK0029_23300 [Armatimonadaceae bacterium]
MGIKIGIVVVVALFVLAWWVSYTGWGLPTTAIAQAQREEIYRTRSVRTGYTYIGSGPRYGK